MNSDGPLGRANLDNRAASLPKGSVRVSVSVVKPHGLTTLDDLFKQLRSG